MEKQKKLNFRLDIEKYKDKITYIIDETDYNNLPSYFDKDVMDNKIIALLKELHDKDDGFYSISNDLLFRAKCKSLNIPCEKFGNESYGQIYKGYQELSGDTKFINDFKFSRINTKSRKYPQSQ